MHLFIVLNLNPVTSNYKKKIKKQQANKKFQQMCSISFLPTLLSRLGTGPRSLHSGGSMAREQRSSGTLRS